MDDERQISRQDSSQTTEAASELDGKTTTDYLGSGGVRPMSPPHVLADAVRVEKRVGMWPQRKRDFEGRKRA